MKNSRQECVVFLAGRRRQESQRRTTRQIPEMELDRSYNSILWVSPLVHWSALDITDYRIAHPELPTNPVTSLLHMSGECLCEAFAKPAERKEIALWFPEVDAELKRLELAARVAGIPEPRCRWGWGQDQQQPADGDKLGPLCASCTVPRGTP